MPRGKPVDARHAPRRRILIVSLTIIAALAAILGGAEVAFGQLYQGKFLPGTAIAGQPVGGLTFAAAETMLQSRIDQFNLQGIAYTAGTSTATMLPMLSSTTADPDVSYSWVTFNIEVTLQSAQPAPQPWPLSTVAKIATWLTGRDVPVAATLDATRLRQALEQNFAANLTPAKPVIVHVNTAGQVFLSESAAGQRWDYENAIARTAPLARRLMNGSITLPSLDDVPAVRRADVSPVLLDQTRAMLARSPLGLTYDETTWPATATIIASWLRFTRASGEVRLDIDQPTVSAYLLDAVAPDIDVSAQAIKFSIVNGKVQEFQPARDGRRLNITASVGAIRALLFNNTATSTALAVDEEQAPVADNNPTEITELVAVGHSNFKGSPANRRYNIAVGAAAVNGTLIQPGQEFSLLKTLGTIDASTGYRQELVIKGNKTIPEYGGGLCQIGTTSFRAALAAGVPITERRNHSYRVVYYEPAGTDATIYDPSPDFKFINDYPTPLLFQTRIKGDDLFFELWGSKDGRLATQTAPVLSNIRAPAAAKLIETLDLKPGEKKCTERAHNGADASFTYAVTYPGGAASSTTFKSHYVPWREVCLIGVTTLSTTSTPDGTPPPNP